MIIKIICLVILMLRHLNKFLTAVVVVVVVVVGGGGIVVPT